MSAWLEARFAALRPQAIAALTRALRDIDLAEEMFAEACLRALQAWPRNGTPRDPLAWLLSVARNAGVDRLRTSARRAALQERNAPLLVPDEIVMPDPDALRDDVLRLMFICCHPALARQDQLALALKIVAGLRIEEVARAFLVKPKTMEQRLTRAKRTIAAHPIPFETPDPAERGRRLGEVSLMIYLMFNEGWTGSDADTQIRPALCEEAIRLARLLLGLFPGMSEQAALLSLLLFQYARRSARMDADGQLLALDEQDRSLWRQPEMIEARSLLQKAERSGHNGPFLLQAAIAYEHARATQSQDTNWLVIEHLYDALYRQQPSPVIALNRIAARSRTKGAAAALEDMRDLETDLASYRWFHTMRAAFLAETGATTCAISALERALELGPTRPEADAIRQQTATLKK